ncbi:MAG: BLUF domain-containing protein [Ghiorsea sp.]
MLVRLIYASRPNKVIGMSEVAKIMSVSKHNNQLSELSGALIYTEHYFMQCLEGDRNAVNQAYTRISKDDRHTDCVLLRYEHVDARIFGQWSMGQIALGKQQNPIIKKYSSHGFFDPYAMNSNQSELFMHDVAKAVSRQHQTATITNLKG